MSVFLLTVLALLPLVIVLGRRCELTVQLLLVTSLVPGLIGFALVSRARGLPEDGLLILLAPSLVAAGLVLRRSAPATHAAGRGQGLLAPGALRWAAVGVLVLTAYHFTVVGIPALSADVETARFALGSSGLAGLPSRALLFGLPILALVTGTHRGRVSGPVTAWVWGGFVLSRLAMGFKGGLVEVVLLALTAGLLRGARLRPGAVAALVAGLAAALSFGLFIGGKYGTLADGGGPGAGYVATRLTTGAAEPAWFLVQYRGEVTSGGSAALHDAKYFAYRYLGVQGGPSFATDQLVSSLVTGTPRSGDSFLVPVTVGGGAYLLASVGLPAAVLGLVLCGVCFSRSCRLLTQGRSLPSAVVAAAVVIALRTFLQNGGGVYLAVNFAFTGALLLAPHALAAFLHGRAPKAPSLSGATVGLPRPVRP